MVHLPRPLDGRALGVFAPASPFNDERFNAGLAILAGLGIRTKLHPQLARRQGFLAGSDAERVQALHELLADDEVGAIIAARGGYGVHRLLPAVDYALVRRAEKALVGFSDLTALHMAALQRADLSGLHGPVVTQLTDLSASDHAQLARALDGALGPALYPADLPPIHPGVAEGPLVGGCLAVITPLVGTPFLHVPEGAILLLEDVQEPPYKVDRMLTHLRLSGVLSRVAGVALGDFVACQPPRDNEQTVDDVLAERLGDLGVVVLAGLPFGHGKRNLCVPLGVRVRLDSATNTLRLLP